MASVRYLARRTGLSPATVSRALNSHPDVSEEARVKILAMADKLGYSVPVKGGASGKAGGGAGRRAGAGIGFMAVGDFEFLTEYDGLLLGGAYRGLSDSSHTLRVINLLRDLQDGESYTAFFRRMGLAGAIIRTESRHRHVCEGIAAEGLFGVVIAEQFATPGMSYIVCEFRAAVRRAVQHLLDLGHRRIGLAASTVGDGDHRDREAGFMEALSSAGLDHDPQLRIEVIPTRASGAAAINQFLALPNPPTALFYADPQPGIGAACRLTELGVRIPEDLSFVCVDDSDTRHRFFPTLTAVVQDTPTLGAEAAVWLNRFAAEPDAPPLRMHVPAVFEVNRSTGLAPSKPVRILPDGTRFLTA